MQIKCAYKWRLMHCYKTFCGMENLRCHSGTKKQEVLDFANKHKGRKIELHYENNMLDSWGDDDVYIYNTTNEKQFNELIGEIEICYIHGIKCAG